jgi:N-terminal domain of reverse transcriptase
VLAYLWQQADAIRTMDPRGAPGRPRRRARAALAGGRALGDFAVADLPAPALDLLLPQQNIRHRIAAEVLEIQSRPPTLRPPQVAGPLEEPLRPVLEHQQHPREVDWAQVDWRRVEADVRRLRQRIFTASRAGDHKKVRNLQKLTAP